ncbi:MULTISPECIES: hypothetical protein [unclassified Sphingomonas]|uniref:hypothetical protein n=1 Tax=unclassified Sphingomonas TaxID=196159 RepID=UPI002151B5BD|nr:MULTISPECIES: hypothetical protein [unclassified Sphingomonas]MCR5870662.1 hypothetical protein [Sphingomonas sp. J344]UUY01000.1 hypothetical protein LRS08_08075 [Sphingomonas sp. J315]
MDDSYLQVRPVKPVDGSFERAFAGDRIAAWGLYEADTDGLPMWLADYPTEAAATTVAIRAGWARGLDVHFDHLDGTTSIRRADHADHA